MASTRMTPRQRAFAAAAGTGACVTVPLFLWFAVEGNALWPGLALALGLVLGLLAIVLTVRWLRAAISGHPPDEGTDTRGHGAI